MNLFADGHVRIGRSGLKEPTSCRTSPTIALDQVVNFTESLNQRHHGHFAFSSNEGTRCGHKRA